MTDAGAPRRDEAGIGYQVLLGVLLVLLLMGPLYPREVAGLRFGQLVAAAITVASLAIVARSRGPLVIALLLGLPSLVLRLVTDDPASPLRAWAVAAVTAYLVFLTGLLVSRLRAHRVVTSATVSGALCVYLLIGTLWTYLYVLVDHVDPQAFRGLPDVAAGDPRLREMALSYFSLVTLTTLGYGDIVPVSPAARSLANTESIVGQLFLVVSVARLVGLQVGHAMARRPDEPPTDR